MVPFRASQHHRRSLRDLDAGNDASRLQPKERTTYNVVMTFPVHPIGAMQGSFEESMLDATGATGFVPFKQPKKTIEQRQHMLCREHDAPELTWNFTYNCHWRNKSKGTYHPLLKTVAQIVFGVHLLHQHLEKSVADVADILLKHVNELDSFLQRANEDIEGSLKDMLFRRKCLKVPMEHVNEFDRLLDDRTYRFQLLEGNVTIERTINRMSQMLDDYSVDINTFQKANQQLDAYLLQIGHNWTALDGDIGRIYSAMCGNTGGWAQFLQSLVAKAEKLGVVLVQVSSYCNEIEKRCGAASRRSMVASRSSSRNSSNSREAARSFRNMAQNKPLPSVPNERPPFVTPPSANVELASGGSSRRQSPPDHARIHVVSHESSQESLREEEEEEEEDDEDRRLTLRQQDIHVAPSDMDETSGDYRNSSGGIDRRSEDVQIVLHQDMYEDTPGPASFSDEKEVVMSDEKEVLVHSPPLTGKDSAYSSVSGTSYASPTSIHPRSASAQSSSHPRAQFGLFPSNGPSTPKHSVSGRYGAVSPALTARRTPEPASPLVPPRASTSLDNHLPSSRNRLLKKTSLSSLKRLFSKKKHNSVDTIVE
ncbi:hypothetical protein PMIN06_007407 [Paraphaeosphaeria minitans]|uniref:Uncharacterized protein n=1 Tax=Paraphaeosphaeria minitans TaxID=565426 RepID=A0A9P6KLA2_9PLEO|nr:hypothetical protein PMIN01_10335 [Paraphaeosphaeria minitans]